MKTYQFLNIFCKNIKSGKFDDKKYRAQRSYYNNMVSTMPTFCSYGTIGYSVNIWLDGDTHNQVTLHYDWEFDKLEIEDNTFGRMDYRHYINLLVLDDNSITKENKEPVWNEHPASVELETYTDAGEDMIISLEEPTRESLQEYIDSFDVNDKVMMWWQNGKESAHKAGVPFDNIRDHYDDYTCYLKELQRVCNLMPY